MRFTHFKECCWSTVCCVAGLLVVVALVLLRIKADSLGEDEFCVVVVVYMIKHTKKCTLRN